ncbi:phage virion morphogenesis protein [Hungatella effluvii]|uniref:phage virion morphogenesis protein n=1 Tax=Hungatella effluvii TaxID=1096246 RepID=UPI0022E31046|nr:phage virion morphogenesis protein [Hungatella effluvii]
MYSIRLEGDIRGLLRKMKAFADLDKKRINAVLAEAVRTSTLERFKTEKDPEGKKWTPSVRSRQEGGKTLTKSGIMKNSIRSSAAPSGFTVGTNVIYASTHQLGEKGRRITIRAKTPKGLVFKIGDRWIRKRQVTIKIKIPARPFLGLSEDDMLEIKGTLEDFLSED